MDVIKQEETKEKVGKVRRPKEHVSSRGGDRKRRTRKKLER